MKPTLPAVLLLILAPLALRAAWLWWPFSSAGAFQVADHAPLYFALSLAHFVCVALLGLSLWVDSPWTDSILYGWTAALTTLGTALLLFDPFSRDSGGGTVIALEVLGIITLVMAFRRRPKVG